MMNKTILRMILATTIISSFLTGCGSHEKATKADPTAKALAISGNVDKTDTGTMIISITADKGWDKDSTPAILHVTQKDEEQEEFYHAVFADDGNTGSTKVELEAGTYTVDFVSPLNHDGSAYEVFDMGEAKDITVDINEDITVDCPMTQIPSDKVTDEMVADIVKATQEAVSKGDDSLKGNAIDTMVNNLAANVANSPNASDATKEAAKDVQEAGTTKAEGAENSKVQSGIKDDKNETVKEDKTNGNSGVQAETGKPESETMADVPSTPVAQPSDTATQAPSDTTVQAPSVTQPVETQPSTTQPTETKPVETTPVHTHTWAEHKATKTEWVANIVTVPDYETKTVYYTVCNCGMRFVRGENGYDDSAREEHAVNHLLAGEPDNTWTESETTQVQVGSHTEDHGHNETVTYTDYVYCTGCNARQ